ncbi:hypothetical protein J3R83DRAFT_4937 [Lanmaoa asiatica]|nr:hypothetical protein J3R83DRAFT_4937 [Lanmaoa asiatica]
MDVEEIFPLPEHRSFYRSTRLTAGAGKRSCSSGFKHAFWARHSRYLMDPTPAVPSPKLFDLSSQNVLITGATRGNVLIAQMIVRK